MKLGASYNFFDGEELLEKSIDSIRNNVDFISIVYQRRSNYGDNSSIYTDDLLTYLVKTGKVDQVLIYNPNFKISAHKNEFNKRKLGLNSCIDAGCDTFMTIDADELYIEEEFSNAKKIFEEGNFDISVCNMYTYYKSLEYVLDPIENYYVGLFNKITPTTRLQFGGSYPVMVDPTRRVKVNKSRPDKLCIFPRDTIMMHHASYVRNDFKKKFMNSSAKINFYDKIDYMVNYMHQWTPDQKAKIMGMDIKEYDIKKVDFWL